MHYGSIGDEDDEELADNYPVEEGKTYIFYERDAADLMVLFNDELSDTDLENVDGGSLVHPENTEEVVKYWNIRKSVFKIGIEQAIREGDTKRAEEKITLYRKEREMWCERLRAYGETDYDGLLGPAEY